MCAQETGETKSRLTIVFHDVAVEIVAENYVRNSYCQCEQDVLLSILFQLCYFFSCFFFLSHLFVHAVCFKRLKCSPESVFIEQFIHCASFYISMTIAQKMKIKIIIIM